MSLIDIQKKLLPDVLEIMQKRFRILQYIRIMEPIGRRMLSEQLHMSERILRSEVTFLKEQSLIVSSGSGMSITPTGLKVLSELEPLMKDFLGLSKLEERLKEKLGNRDVVILPGDSDENDVVKKEMGRACVSHLKSCLFENKNVIAVTGGTTIAAVADMMTPFSKEREALFVPARGGFGENAKHQANSICAHMAEKANGEYRLLHIPDQVSEDVYDSLINDPAVKEVLELIQSPTHLLHGIGDAMMMAKRRNTPSDVIELLRAKHAVSEAFGYYFNENGDVVHKINTAGLKLETVKRVPCVIAVAGGASKAMAIVSYMQHTPTTILVTDEGAARAILSDKQ